jgi:hypothetical protein
VQKFFVLFLFIGGGIFLIVQQVRSLKGQGNKAAYLADHIYAGRIYGRVPFGLLFLSWGIAIIFPQFPDLQTFFLSLGIGSGVVGLIFCFIQPSFLKPDWYKWLESQHSDVMPLLRKEMLKIGELEWSRQMQTQTDFEEWIAEVRKKYKL